MDQHIRNFFWKGGKQNERKIHLVSLETVLKPQMEGGLNFKKLPLQNIAMGAKLLWKIIARNPCWAQLALWRKYFKGERIRCLDGPLPQGTSPYARLCSKDPPLIHSKVYWIPGNGEKINIWTNRIMDHDPIGDFPSVKALRDWLNASGKSTLWDISTWEGTRWAGWSLFDLPLDLLQDSICLRAMLNGVSPSHIRRKDRCGWGTSTVGFTVAQGYANLTSIPNVPPDPAPWKAVWGIPSLPKINMFFWLLCQRKILTDDNLQRRGFYGPSRCSLCREKAECATHLILKCNFAV